MRDDASARKLEPLSRDLAPELRELAEFLRGHFYKVNTSVRAYAHRINRDPGVVSRYLSGDRIPPQDFADSLLADAGPQRSSEEVEREQALVLDLRLKALRVRNVRAAKSEQITQELAAAEQEISLLRAKERTIVKALVKAEADYKSLYDKYQEMENRIKNGPPQITGSSTLQRLEDERDRAREEVMLLVDELAKEKEKRIAAEKRRDALQARLDMNESALVRAGGSDFAVGTYDSERQLLVILRGRATRWGGVVGLVAVPIVILGIPIYLGLVYHTLTQGQLSLKVMTICGLLIPAWFALAILKVERPEDVRKLRQVVSLIAVTALLFFVASLI
jgi:hypothetical protein